MASALFDRTALEELAEFILRFEADCHSTFAVADRNRELATLVLRAASLLNDSPWHVRIAPVFHTKISIARLARIRVKPMTKKKQKYLNMLDEFSHSRRRSRPSAPGDDGAVLRRLHPREETLCRLSTTSSRPAHKQARITPTDLPPRHDELREWAALRRSTVEPDAIETIQLGLHATRDQGQQPIGGAGRHGQGNTVLIISRQ